MSTVEELRTIQKRLSETMRYIQQQQQEKENLVSRVTALEAQVRNMMSDSASSARRRRNKPDVLRMDEELETARDDLLKKEQEIGQLWLKISELQTQEKSLTS